MLRSWVTVLLGLAVAQGASALALIMVARRVAPVDYGQYLASYGLVSLLVVLPSLGLDQWFLAKGLVTSGQVVHLWRGALHLRLRLLLLWLAMIAVLAFLLPADTFPPSLVILSAFGLAADSVSLLSYVALRKLNQHRSVTACQASGAVLLLAGTFVLPLSGGRLIEFALLRTLISVGVACGSGWWTSIMAGRLSSDAAETPPLQEARPFFAAEIAVAAYMRADLTIVSAVLGPEAAGVYGPALNVVNLFFIVPNAVYLLVVPILARLFDDSRRLYFRLGSQQVAAQAALGFLIAITLFVAAVPITGLIFGPQYLLSARIVRQLSVLMVFKALSFGFGAILSTAGQQSRRTVVQISVAVFNVLLNLVVVRQWGVSGVAIVYVLSEALLCIGYLLLLAKWRRTLAPPVNAV